MSADVSGPSGEALRILERCKRGVDAVHDVHVLTTTEAQIIAARLAALQQERDKANERVKRQVEGWTEEIQIRQNVQADVKFLAESVEKHVALATLAAEQRNAAEALVASHQRRVEELTDERDRLLLSRAEWKAAYNAALTHPEQGGTPS